MENIGRASILRSTASLFFAAASALMLARRIARRRVRTYERVLFSFGVITDIQYADIDDQGDRFYRNVLKVR